MKRLLFFSAWLVAGAMFTGTVRAGETDKQQQPETVLEVSDVADTIIYNAKVLTVNSNFTVAKAIAIRNGRIIAVGRDRQLEEYRGPNTWMFDAQGNTVMPGLYDANVMSYRAAVSELNGPMLAIDSITNAQNYIHSQASNKPPGGWIILNDIPPTRLKEGRLPTKEELDAATTTHPVVWEFGPTVVVNSKALEISGITNANMSPMDGEIVVDSRHHRPTGLLRGTAATLLKIPAAQLQHTVTAAQERAALKKLYALYNQQGITSIAEAAATPQAIDLFRQMSKSNELTVRITAGRLFKPSADADESIDRLSVLTTGTNTQAKGLPYGPTGVGDDWVRIGPLQTVIDGNASMGTAYLRTPYGIGPTYMISELAYRGDLKQDAFALPQVYLAAAQQGWQLSAHCEGDAALDFLLNAYQQVQFKTNISDKRFLIVHTEFQAAQDWKRCEDLGVGAILNPNSLYEDTDSLTRTLGTNRMTYYTPMKGWFDRGMVIGGGSDHFAGSNSLNTTSPWNPWLGMWVTLTRQTKEGTEINPKESLTREQAVKFYTYNNAWMNREENDRGSLEVGKLADLVLLDTDILKCPVDDIRNTKVLMTMVNGKVVWQAIEPIFQGPQVIPSVTIIVTNMVTNQTTIITTTNVVTPATPVVAKTPTAPATQNKATTAAFDPFAPIPVPEGASTNDVTAAATDAAKNAAEASTQQPVNTAQTPTTTSNQATIVTVTVQTASTTNTTTVTTPTVAPATTPTPTTTPAVATTPATQAAPQTTTTPAVPATTTTPASGEKGATTDAAASGDNISGVGGAAPAELQGNTTLPPTAAASTNVAGPTVAPQTTIATTNAGPTVAPQTTVATTNAGPTTAPATPATTVAATVQPAAAPASQVPVPAAAAPPVAVAKATTTTGATTNQADANDWSHLGNQSAPAGK